MGDGKKKKKKKANEKHKQYNRITIIFKSLLHEGAAYVVRGIFIVLDF